MASDELSRALTEWGDDSRLEAARATRNSQRWNEQAAAESSTFGGLLLDLYETSTPVVLQIKSQRIVAGVIVEVGRNFVAVAAAGQARVFLPFTSIGAVQIATNSRRTGAVSDREPEGIELIDVLGQLAADRVHVRFLTTMNDQVRSGTMIAAGADLITVALDSMSETVFIPLSQLSELTVA